MKTIPIIILLFFALASCQKKQETKESTHEHTGDEESGNRVELTEAQYQSAGIQTGGLSVRNLSDVVTANGVIDIPPSNLVSISAPMGGFVRKTDLLQGMKVRKGQVLAVIENPDFIQIQQDYLETESELSYAETEYTRQQQLSNENVNAKKIFQQATTQVRTLKARLAGLRERLKTANINVKELEKGVIVNQANVVASITGSVTAVNVNIGKYVNPTDVMFEIVDTDHLHVELSVFERDVPKLKIGQLVRFTVNDDREGLAKVYLINPKINEDRTVRVHCHLVKDDPALLPQNYVKAIIETGSNPLPALPDAAITVFDGKSYVFIETGKEVEKEVRYLFEMIEVQKGISENGYTAVNLPADKANQKIVLKGAYALLSQLKNSGDDDHGH